MGLLVAGPDERARESIKARTAGLQIDNGWLPHGNPVGERAQINVKRRSFCFEALATGTGSSS
jgi:hypothetical protein